ncbi:carboxypeptidase Y-deficient, partial [Serendipita sp. 401]
KIEDRRLERRLEKLIDLHFSSSSKPSTPIANMPEKPAQPRRQSSFFDFDLSELKGKNASDLWRGVLDSAASTRLGGVNAKGEIRQQEMAITPWQEDSSVPACPLCLASFNALTNRKHHCRLCGRVVCSLPIKPPNRNELCSFLFFVDSKTGGIEELSGDMIDYGVKRKDIGIAKGDAAFAKKLAEEQEKYLKGVRICRDCRPALRRKQYSVESATVPPIARLYDALLALEKEIEEMLPSFQELVIRISQDENDTTSSHLQNGAQQNSSIKQASNLRKHLLDAFSQYDAIAKRIKSLRVTPGSSQEKVQSAISNRATLFLQRNLFPLQSLPKPKMTHSKNSSTTTLSLPTNLGDITDQDAALAHTLQPLLEQEALLESFVEEATAQRKFEDAKTLKANLKEIRGEIERLLNGRGLPGQGASAK